MTVNKISFTTNVILFLMELLPMLARQGTEQEFHRWTSKNKYVTTHLVIRFDASVTKDLFCHLLLQVWELPKHDQKMQTNIEIPKR